jgi:hypothetical protein
LISVFTVKSPDAALRPSFVIAVYDKYSRRNAGPRDLRAFPANFLRSRPNFDYLRVHQYSPALSTRVHFHKAFKAGSNHNLEFGKVSGIKFHFLLAMIACDDILIINSFNKEV